VRKYNNIQVYVQMTTFDILKCVYNIAVVEYLKRQTKNLLRRSPMNLPRYLDSITFYHVYPKLLHIMIIQPKNEINYACHHIYSSLVIWDAHSG